MSEIKGRRSIPTDIEILYEDNHMLVVNKRPGDIVQGDKTGDTPLVNVAKEYIKKKYDKPGAVYLGVVHRIDRPVSGAVIFARTSKALTRLNAAFKDRKVEKTYWAVVRQRPEMEEGRLTHYLRKMERHNISKAYDKEVSGSKRSVLDYRLCQSSDNYHLLEIHPQTGRHHQIRVQLSKMGCPIKGDIKYGDRRTNKDASIHLHARALKLEHPVRKEPMLITAPVPNEPLWQAMDQ